MLKGPYIELRKTGGDPYCLVYLHEYCRENLVKPFKSVRIILQSPYFIIVLES